MEFVKSEIVIFEKATGKMLMMAPATLKPTDTTQGWVAIPSGYVPETYSWNAVTKTLAEDIAKVKTKAIETIKSTAETKKMDFLSSGGAKKAEYAQKAAEVAFYDSLGGTVSIILSAIALLPAAVKQAKFSYSLADAAAFGETDISKAIERFRAGMTSSNKVPAIAAAEAKACDTIKKATTVTAVKAVTVTWP